jgi:MoxR-like ATPase
MPNYSMMSSEELWANLWPILQREAPTYKPEYVLTPDNFLKMALIALRAEAGVPVIIMGETGCGKTSLLKNLALYCGVEFFCVTLHAGTSEDEIRTFVAWAEAVAERGPKKVSFSPSFY